MDHYSNINSDVCYGNMVYNKPVMPSKTDDCRSCCREGVRVSSETL